MPVDKGVEFLGSFVLPYRIYLSRSTLDRMDAKLDLLAEEGRTSHLANAISSYCGVLSHWNNYHARLMMLTQRHDFTSSGMFNYEVTRFYD